MAWTGARRPLAGGSTEADGMVRTLVCPTGAHGEISHPARLNDVMQGMHLRPPISIRLRWRSRTGLPPLRSGCLHRTGGLQMPARFTTPVYHVVLGLSLTVKNVDVINL